MILRVTIENLYSFMEETEISFVAGKSTLHSEQVSRAEKRDDISVLKAGIIMEPTLQVKATSLNLFP